MEINIKIEYTDGGIEYLHITTKLQESLYISMSTHHTEISCGVSNLEGLLDDDNIEYYANKLNKSLDDFIEIYKKLLIDIIDKVKEGYLEFSGCAFVLLSNCNTSNKSIVNSILDGICNRQSDTKINPNSLNPIKSMDNLKHEEISNGCYQMYFEDERIDIDYEDDWCWSIQINNNPLYNCQISTCGGIDRIIAVFKPNEIKDILQYIYKNITNKTNLLIDIYSDEDDEYDEYQRYQNILSAVGEENILFKQEYTNTTGSLMCMYLLRIDNLK